MRYKFLLPLFFLLIATPAYATTRTWTGTTSNKWDLDANWGGTKPAAGDDLVFPSSASNKSTSNDIAADTSFNSITFDGIGYTLAGNEITLVNGITQSVTGTTNVISLAIILSADQTITMSNSGGTLTITGIISGAQVLSKAGAGTVSLQGANTFSNGLVIKAGTVSVRTDVAAGGAGTITIGDSSGSANATLSEAQILTYANNIIVASGNTGVLKIDSTTSGGTFSGTVTLNNNLTVGGASGKVLTLSGVISGAFKVTKVDAGQVTLSGHNTFSNGLFVYAGTLALATDAWSGGGSGTGVITLGDSSGSTAANLSTINNLTYANPITVASGSGGALTIAVSGGAILSGLTTLAHNLLLNFSGLSNCSISGGFTGTGNLTISTLSTASQTIVASANGIDIIGSITNSGTSAGLVTISDVIKPNVTLITQNSTVSNLTLSGVNTYTGPITNSAGTLNITKDATYSTMTLAADTTTNITATKTITLANLVSTGTSGHLAVLKSATSAAHTLTTASAQISTDYLNLTYSQPTQINTWYAGANSTNGGNNGNWIFTAPPSGAANTSQVIFINE